MNYAAIKKQIINKVGFMKWAKLDMDAIREVQLYGENYKEIWFTPDVNSLWIAFDDGHGIGQSELCYGDMEDFESPIEMIQEGIADASDYDEGDTGKIARLIDGYGYKAGSEMNVSLENLESWENFFSLTDREDESEDDSPETYTDVDTSEHRELEAEKNEVKEEIEKAELNKSYPILFDTESGTIVRFKVHVLNKKGNRGYGFTVYYEDGERVTSLTFESIEDAKKDLLRYITA